MTSNTAVKSLRPSDTPNPRDEELVIRPYEPRDQQECREIFTQGMEQLVNLVMQVVFPRYCRYIAILSVFAILAAMRWSFWILGLYALASLMVLAALYVDIYLECWKFINYCLTTDLWDINKSYMTNKGSQMFVAQWEGKIVGMVGLAHNDTHQSGVAELQRMSVSPQCRRMGIARKLSHELILFARDQKYENIVLSTTSVQKPAMALYKRCGFKLVDVLPYPQRVLGDLEYHCFELQL